VFVRVSENVCVCVCVCVCVRAPVCVNVFATVYIYREGVKNAVCFRM